MPFSYTGVVLRVNLSNGRILTETPDETFYRTMLGGRNLIAYYLLREVSPSVEPLGPENKLIFATGVLTGVPIGCTGRNSVGAKSPLTGGYGESEAGGYFGAELKFAGFDAIIIEGTSPEPVYLWVNDGTVELRPAAKIWGCDIYTGEQIIREELNDHHVRTAQIGTAGENMVRYATIANDVTHVYGRCGLGAVMGSKKLRAVAARGHKRLAVANPAAIKKYGRQFASSWRESFSDLFDVGTMGSLLPLNEMGGLPTRNFQAGSIPSAESIDGIRLRDDYLVGREGCFACGIKCKRLVQVDSSDEAIRVDPAFGGPEYETGAALGSNCGITDLAMICKANELCNRYGVDTISVGVVIAWLMECYERGIIRPEECDGLDASFGNGAVVLELISKIADREGVGDLLAEGVARAAQTTGRGSEKYAMHVKGLEIPMHEPRIKHGLGLGYAVSPTGADHVHNIHDDLYSLEESPFFDRIKSQGILEPLPPTNLDSAKARLFASDVLWWSLFNCLELCSNGPYVLDLNLVNDIVQAATGWNTSLWELGKVAERCLTMPQLYNIRAGMTTKEDALPERFFETLSASATGKALDKEQMEAARQLYYQMRGWDPETGIPTDAKLIELGLQQFIS